MSGPRAALDVALEVLADGYKCADALEEWMRRLPAEGLRYCPLAVEQVLLSCIDEDQAEPALEFPEEVQALVEEAPAEGSLVIPEIELEPTPEELAAEQGKLPPAPAPVAELVFVVRFSYQAAPPGQRDASTLHEGELFRGDLVGADAAYDAAQPFGWPTEFAEYRFNDGFLLRRKIVNP